jgi:putative flippase GtrA
MDTIRTRTIVAAGNPNFVTFLLTSGISVLVNLLLRYELSRIVPFEEAVAFAYVASTIVAFLLARAFVFGSTQRWQAELGRFVVVNVFGFLQVMAVGILLLRWLFPAMNLHRHTAELAHFLALASLSFTSFFAHRHFSFRGAVLRRSRL